MKKVPGTIEGLSRCPNSFLDRKNRIIQECIKIVRDKAHFQQIEIPIMEPKELYVRGLGAESDVVFKELYSVQRQNTSFKNEEIVLRPEGTAGVARSLLSNGTWLQKRIPLRTWYNGAMFRGERPQLGRFRQFDQFGIEVFGCKNHLTDVECIELGYRILDNLGLKNEIRMRINSLGDSKVVLPAYRTALSKYLKSLGPDLISLDSQRRLENGNVLRILDSKNAKDIEALTEAPKIQEFYDEATRKRFDSICNHLSSINIPFEVDPFLVRGLDYYNDTVFEITSKSDEKSTFLAGGRYDNLIDSFKSSSTTTTTKSIAGFGWALGLDRLAQAMKDEDVWRSEEKAPILLLMLANRKDQDQSDEIALESFVMKVMRHLRFQLNQNVRLEIIPCDKSKIAQAMGRLLGVFPELSHVLMIGSADARKGQISVKNLGTRNQSYLSFADLSAHFSSDRLMEEGRASIIFNQTA